MDGSHHDWLEGRGPKTMNLDGILCLKANRTINHGFLIKAKNRLFIVQKPSLVMKGRMVEVREHFDGRLDFLWQGRLLEVREVQEAISVKPKKVKAVAETRKKSHISLRQIILGAAGIQACLRTAPSKEFSPWRNRTFSLCLDRDSVILDSSRTLIYPYPRGQDAISR